MPGRLGTFRASGQVTTIWICEKWHIQRERKRRHRDVSDSAILECIIFVKSVLAGLCARNPFLASLILSCLSHFLSFFRVQPGSDFRENKFELNRLTSNTATKNRVEPAQLDFGWKKRAKLAWGWGWTWIYGGRSVFLGVFPLFSTQKNTWITDTFEAPIQTSLWTAAENGWRAAAPEPLRLRAPVRTCSITTFLLISLKINKMPMRVPGLSFHVKPENSISWSLSHLGYLYPGTAPVMIKLDEVWSNWLVLKY